MFLFTAALYRCSVWETCAIQNIQNSKISHKVKVGHSYGNSDYLTNNSYKSYPTTVNRNNFNFESIFLNRLAIVGVAIIYIAS